jgi:hypothetical protein
MLTVTLNDGPLETGAGLDSAVATAATPSNAERR